LFSLIGCDAFVRKFTRKPKKKESWEIDMVLAPEEYKPTMTKEEQYRQYFLFWQSWQDELMEALLQNKSLKKRVDCAQQAVNNLVNMQQLLNDVQKKKLQIYIVRMKDLKRNVGGDIYGSENGANFHKAEILKLDIQKNFSFSDVKNSII
jgi:hypothetical protein